MVLEIKEKSEMIQQSTGKMLMTLASNFTTAATNNDRNAIMQLYININRASISTINLNNCFDNILLLKSDNLCISNTRNTLSQAWSNATNLQLYPSLNVTFNDASYYISQINNTINEFNSKNMYEFLVNATIALNSIMTQEAIFLPKQNSIVAMHENENAGSENLVNQFYITLMIIVLLFILMLASLLYGMSRLQITTDVAFECIDEIGEKKLNTVLIRNHHESKSLNSNNHSNENLNSNDIMSKEITTDIMTESQAVLLKVDDGVNGN